jgi:hypothetical protein
MFVILENPAKHTVWSMGFLVARTHGGSAMHLQKQTQEQVTAMQ